MKFHKLKFSGSSVAIVELLGVVELSNPCVILWPAKVAWSVGSFVLLGSVVELSRLTNLDSIDVRLGEGVGVTLSGSTLIVTRLGDGVIGLSDGVLGVVDKGNDVGEVETGGVPNSLGVGGSQTESVIRSLTPGCVRWRLKRSWIFGEMVRREKIKFSHCVVSKGSVRVLTSGY